MLNIIFIMLLLVGSRVKYSVVAEIFTGIAFGLSIVLWAFMPSVRILPPIDGAPLYVIHPLFTSQFLLMLSTLIAWPVLLLLSFRHVHRQKETLTDIVRRDWFGFLLAFVASVGALSGCMVYSENMQLGEFLLVNGLRALPGIPPPNPFLVINVVALLLYELLWAVSILSRFLRRAR